MAMEAYAIMSEHVQRMSGQTSSCAEMCLSTFQSLFHALVCSIEHLATHLLQ